MILHVSAEQASDLRHARVRRAQVTLTASILSIGAAVYAGVNDVPLVVAIAILYAAATAAVGLWSLRPTLAEVVYRASLTAPPSAAVDEEPQTTLDAARPKSFEPAAA